MLIKAAGSRIAEAPQLAVVASGHNFAGASIQAKEKKTLNKQARGDKELAAVAQFTRLAKGK